MIRRLFLDDDPRRSPRGVSSWMRDRCDEGTIFEYWCDGWDTVRNYQEFTEYITRHGLPDTISFDHDLADEHYAPENSWKNYNDWATKQKFKEKTGKDCAVWLCNYCIEQSLPLPKVLVHSLNPVGVENIESVFTNYNKHTYGKTR